MSITSLSRDLSNDPCMVRMTSTDNLATVAGSNYIKNQIPNTTALNHGVWQWNVGDLVAVAASDGDQIFRFSGNNFTTLVNLPSSGGGGGTVTVTGSTPTVGDFAAFSGATSIADTGFLPSSNSNSIVSTISTAISNGSFAVFQDTNGSIGDSGYFPSQPSSGAVPILFSTATVNHIPSFKDTNGTLQDVGYVPSNIAKTNVAMVELSTVPTVTELAIFQDSSGTIGTSPGMAGHAVFLHGNIQSGDNANSVPGAFVVFPGAPGTGDMLYGASQNSGNFSVTLQNAPHAQNSNYSIPDCGDANGLLLNKVSGAFTVNHLLSSSSRDGVVNDSGIAVPDVQLNTNIKAAQSADIGGGGAGPLVVSATGLTSASVVVATVLSSSNPVSVIACVAGTDQFSITLSADPGASCIVNWVAFVAPQ